MADRRRIQAQIRKLIEFDPTVKNRVIAETLGISRQLVHYHTKALQLRGIPLVREGVSRGCRGGCGRRVEKDRKHQLCRGCLRLSYAYEFACGECGKVNVIYGRLAACRRRNAKFLKDKQIDFCDRRCSGRHNQRSYWAIRRLTQEAT